ncbi:MAG: aromatic ring-hydroxylating dioxygenase subunit alpha [Pseudomonadota bacterium]
MTQTDFVVPPGWYILCRARQLGRKPKRFMHAGRALVAFRTGDKKLGVLEDRCAHRAVPLSEGKVCGETVQCPYHGWQFDLQGKVTHVPALSACANAANQARVRAWPSVEQEGFVWIWSGDGEAPGAPPLMTNYRAPGWTSFVMQTRFKASVDACLENFLDCPHATFVHKYWFRAPTRQSVKAVVTTLDDGAQAEFFEEPREKSVVWSMLAPRDGKMEHTDRFIAPNTSRVDYVFPGGLHYIITSVCNPINAFETEVITVMTFRYKRVGWLVRLFFEPLSRWIIRQDVAMLGLQQRNLGPGQVRGPMVSTEADLLGTHIITWRKSMLDKTAPPTAGQQRDHEIFL